MSLGSINNEIFYILHFVYIFAITCHISILKTWIYHHWIHLIETNPISHISSFYYHWIASYCIFTIFIKFRNFKKFCWNFDKNSNNAITRYPVMVEGRNMAHWIRLYEVNRMAVNSCLQDRYMASYCKDIYKM